MLQWTQSNLESDEKNKSDLSKIIKMIWVSSKSLDNKNCIICVFFYLSFNQYN